MGPSGGMAAPVLALSKEDRILHFGIDCGVDSLTWRGGTWQPGGDYAKNLTIRNVSAETIKLKYKVPETKFFSMDFPELIKLSPGMSVTVSVVFRPIRYERYDDYVEFVVKRKRFHVPVRARLSKLAVSVPESLDFGFCPSREVAERTFEVTNTGEIPARFKWTVKAPFKLSPSSGTVEPGCAATITASFEPTGAAVFVSRAICAVDDLDDYVFKISGIGKYTFLSTSDEMVDFGDRLCGEAGVADKEIVLRNQSLVHATFSVSRLETDCEPVFSITPMAGVVQPGEEQQFRVQYTPLATGQFSSDTFAISTPGGNTVHVRCTGRAVGPVVHLSQKMPPLKSGAKPPRPDGVQFGDVDCGTEDGKTPGTSTRVLILTNNTQQPAYFHLTAERCGAAFEFHDNVAGFVPAGLTHSIAVTFRPTKPGNYYRRIFCLFRDQMPQYVDFVGTAFDAAHRPQPLLLRHIYAHRRREIVDRPRGVARFNPENILSLAEEGRDPGGPDWEGSVTEPESSTRVTRSGEANCGAIEVLRQFFMPPSSDQRAISVAEEELDFGMGSRLRLSDKKTLHVTNRTESKMVCAWSVPAPGGHDTKPAFAIHPESADIAPGKTAEFRVAFRPEVDNYYYCVEACAYVSVKSNRTFRLVNDAAFIPPTFVAVRLRGHTFGAGSEQFLPKVHFRVHGEGRRLEFPSCHLGDSVYQTIMLENTSDTPAQFAFAKDPSGIFTAKPNGGLIGRNQAQLVALRFTPPSLGSHSHTLRCVLNNSKEDVHSLALAGNCFVPSATLSENIVVQSDAKDSSGKADVMYFKPTSVGLVSVRTFVIRNPSRVPLTFQWLVPPRFRSILRVQPNVGRLMGNESATLHWSFAPQDVRRYSIHVPLLVRSVNEAKPTQRTSLTVLAEGTQGAVVFEPASLDFGTSLVGTEAKRELVMVNSADCDVAYELYAVRVDDLEESTFVPNPASQLPVLEFSRPCGLLPARSRIRSRVTFRPRVRGDYAFRLECKMRNAAMPDELHAPENALARTLSLGPEATGDATKGIIFDQSTSLVLWNSDETYKAPPPIAALSGVTLECPAKGSAAYPVLLVDDIRSATVSTAQLWKQFQIKALNRAMRTPLTPAEIRFAHSTGVQQTGDKDAAEEEPIPRFDFMFTPALFASPTEVVLLQLRNNGHLPVSFYFKFPDDLDVELEPWADAGEQVPTAEELQQSAILDAKLFEIAPRKGLLSAGEACTVRLSYKHSMLDYEGLHEIPVLFTLTNGKQTRIVLKGHTLSVGRPFLHAGVSPVVWDLGPRRIGQRSAPSVGYALHNPGNSEVEYNVDVSPLEDLSKSNWDYAVLSCLNPEGTVPGGGSTMIRFRFSPLEAKTYETNIRVRFTAPGGLGGGQMEIKLVGNGFHPRDGVETTYTEEEAADIHAGNSQDALTPPKCQLLPLPGQVGALSLDRIVFGVVPRGAVVVRLSLLTNHTATALSFKWDDSHSLVTSGRLRVTPRGGRIAAGEFVTCKFVLLSAEGSDDDNTTSVVDTDLSCELYTIAAANVTRQGSSTKIGGRRNSVSRASSVRPRRSVTRNTAHQSVVGRSTASRDIRLALTSTTAGAGGVVNEPALETFMGLEHMASLPGVGDAQFLTSAGDADLGNRSPLFEAQPQRSTSRALSTAGSSRLGGSVAQHVASSLPHGDIVGLEPGTSLVYAHIEATIVDAQEFRKDNLDASRAYFVPKPDKGEVRALIESSAADEVAPAEARERAIFREPQYQDESDAHPPAPLPSSAPAAPPPLPADSIAATNEALLSLLVRDVVCDPSVKRTISELPTEPTPYFLQLSNLPGSAMPTPRVATPQLERVAPDDELLDDERTVDGARGGWTSSGISAVEQLVAAERRRRFMVLPECQNLVEAVLENTVYNLVQEAAHGEISLTTQPRKVLRVVDQ